MHDLLLRFLIGGLVVSSFAVLGEIFRPRSFAGLFGAAPSIALATLGLTILRHGHAYASIEGRSMLLGAIAFFCYACAVSWTLMRFRTHALATTLVWIPLWFVISFGLHVLLARWLA